MHFSARWVFDLAADMLYLTDDQYHKRIPLAPFRERLVSQDSAEWEILGMPVPLPMDPPMCTDMALWEPAVEVDDRTRAFTHRMLKDFHHQWRHIFRNDFNILTLRSMARAIIHIATLRFKWYETRGVYEGKPAKNGKKKKKGRGNKVDRTNVNLVQSTDLPSWPGYGMDIVFVGNAYLCLCLSIEEGLSMVRNHAGNKLEGSRMDWIYVVFSIKHIALCRQTGKGTFECTAPEHFFHGNWYMPPPSQRALDYLVWGLESARSAFPNRIQYLPVELQDMILEHEIKGLPPHCQLRRAFVNCALGLGTPYEWEDFRLLQVVYGDTWHIIKSRFEVCIPYKQVRYATGLIYEFSGDDSYFRDQDDEEESE